MKTADRPEKDVVTAIDYDGVHQLIITNITLEDAWLATNLENACSLPDWC